MSYNEIKAALALLGRTGRDVIEELRSRGINVSDCTFSKAIKNVDTSPAIQKIRKETITILNEWKRKGENHGLQSITLN